MKNKSFSFKKLALGLLSIFIYFLIPNVLLLNCNRYIPVTNKNLAYYNLILYFITLIVFIIIYRELIINNFKDFLKNYKKYLPKAFSYWIKGFFLMIASNYILNIILKIGQSSNELQNIALIKENLLVHSITIIFVAPILEEIAFRLSFHKMTNNKHIFAIITGTIFGFVHIISSLDPAKLQYLLLLIPYASMGIALGYAYKETDNIFSSLAMHMFHNTLTLIIIIIGIKGGII